MTDTATPDEKEARRADLLAELAELDERDAADATAAAIDAQPDTQKVEPDDVANARADGLGEDRPAPFVPPEVIVADPQARCGACGTPMRVHDERAPQGCIPRGV